MNLKKLLLGFLFVDFAAFNAYVVYTLGYDGFVREAIASLGSIAVLVDLSIALSLVFYWMVRDARRRGISVLPYVPLTPGAAASACSPMCRSWWPSAP